MIRMHRHLGLGLALVALSCGGDDSAGNQDSGGTTTVQSGINLDGSSDDAADSSAPKLDVGSAQTVGTNPDDQEMGCQKVDVVFSVDNSGSMQEEIAEMQGAVFDAFPDALLAVNGGLLDFQLAVIDACNNPANFHNHGTPGDCNFANGANYMVSSNPELASEYACVMQLDTSGWNDQADACSGQNDDEAPANTAADAVSADNKANVGFVRNDAVLLIVAMTDEDEKPVPDASAQEIADKIIAGAGGSIDDVVFLAIAGGSDCDGPYGSAEDAAFLREVAQIFVDADRGIFWDLCTGDIPAAFEAVVDVVDVACTEFDPVG